MAVTAAAAAGEKAMAAAEAASSTSVRKLGFMLLDDCWMEHPDDPCASGSWHSQRQPFGNNLLPCLSDSLMKAKFIS
jgi:hypothetical protein